MQEKEKSEGEVERKRKSLNKKEMGKGVRGKERGGGEQEKKRKVS